MRISSLIRYVGMSLAFAATPLAALAVTVDADVTLVLPSDGTLYTLKSGSSFDQFSSSGDTFTFQGDTGGSVNVDLRSGGKKTLTNNRNIATVCGDSESSLVISTGPGNTTVTPSGTCGSGGGGGGTAGGGGGGGGGGSAAPAPATVDKVSQLKQQIAAVQRQIAQKISAAGGKVGTAISLVAKNLKLGDRNDDVRTLQQLLARDTAIYPEGLATGSFGPATQRAVKRFQEKYGIQSLGSVGPQTRAKLAEVFGAVAAPTAPPAASAAEPAPVGSGASNVAVSAGVPSRVLAPGMRDDQVRDLQQILASDPSVYPEGTVSGYYGPATARAVRAFQLKHGVIQSESDAGNGRVGPKTLAKLQEVFSSLAPAPASVPAPTPATAPPAATVAPVAPASDAQVKAVQEQIQALQAKILQQQIKLIQEKINALKK